MSHSCPGADKSPLWAGESAATGSQRLSSNPATSSVGTATWAEVELGASAWGMGALPTLGVSLGGGKAQAVHTGVPECVEWRWWDVMGQGAGAGRGGHPGGGRAFWGPTTWEHRAGGWVGGDAPGGLSSGLAWLSWWWGWAFYSPSPCI